MPVPPTAACVFKRCNVNHATCPPGVWLLCLQLTGELSATHLEGWLQGPGPPPQSPTASVGTPSSSSSSTHSSSSRGSRWVSPEELVMGPTPSTVDWQGEVAAALEPRAASATLNASRLARAAAGMAGADPTAGAAASGGDTSSSRSPHGLRGSGDPSAGGGGGLPGGRLTVVAGAGRVRLVARSWMDAIRAAMGQQQQQQQKGQHQQQQHGRQRH